MAYDANTHKVFISFHHEDELYKKRFAKIYNWKDDGDTIKKWIDEAFNRRDIQPDPDNSRWPLKRDHTGDYREGWKGY